MGGPCWIHSQYVFPWIFSLSNVYYIHPVSFTVDVALQRWSHFFIDFGSVPECKCFVYELLTLCGAVYPISERHMLGNTEKYKQKDIDQVCEGTKQDVSASPLYSHDSKHLRDLQ